MRILLFGRDGQVGWELQRALSPVGELIALGRGAEGGLSGEFTDPDSLARTVRSAEPDVIVNAAAYTSVDRAESEPELARIINAEAPGVLAQEAKKLGALLVHYSTDYVFDGSGSRGWKEFDAPAPLNVYGHTKLAGEESIHQAGCHHLLFRTSWVYAARGRNFIRNMLGLFGKQHSLEIIDDQFGAPTGAELIADVTGHALSVTLDKMDLCGTYHLAASGETNWYGYARCILQTACHTGFPIHRDKIVLKPVSTEAFPSAAERPHNSRLDCRKIEETFGVRLPDWKIGVKRALSEILYYQQTGEGDP